ncbi:MAG: aminodeoxychorismate synthase component I [Corynebacterium sp.]|uniref:aminodeoxychorismate synthase component I n=1 Tax=Corynebacterium sp. TaxID=1720 RepID=UPI0026DAF4BD|nr:aminodeoxychorismate synthase component I [Corynebacterium sp.]MDO4761355.1 aminodeoxychorismate synthase component I [Corynebacterium sp.]
MKVLVIDHRDSFTYNLVAYIEDETNSAPTVVDFREPLSVDFANSFDAIVCSPGPGRVDNPDDIGSTLAIIAQTTTPLLGVCLGHQAICYAFGGGTALAPLPVHGQTDLITHEGSGLFSSLTSPLEVVRYHSLVADPIPEQLRVTATSRDNIVMALEHKLRPIWGVQFHPESVGGFDGHVLVRNFLALARDYNRRHRGGAGAHTGAVRDDAATSTQAHPGRAVSTIRNTSSLSVQALSLKGCVDAQRIAADAPFWLDASDHAHADGGMSYVGVAGGPLSSTVSGDGFSVLENSLVRADISAVADLGLGFNLGLVGYLGYELKAECGGSAAHQAPTPNIQLFFADRMIAIDHRNMRTHVLYLVDQDSPELIEQQVAWARQMKEELVALMDSDAPAIERGAGSLSVGPVTARFSKDEYIDLIHACHEAIVAGESYEVCLTNQLSAQIEACDVCASYGEFRRANPSPLGALVRFGDLALLSSSPERFLKCDRFGVVESRPIKGTRARGATPEEDERLRLDLATNAKDRAENLMIVDLVRNDLSRVAVPGTVKAEPLFAVESFATVHQLVSTIRAQLAEQYSLVDLLKATFPGGSMTGAPKIRTMDIIDELEKAPRGIYSGAVGYFGVDGAMDLSMVIRSIVIHGDRVTYGVGGAIVALSDPEEEYAETLTKATPLLRLIGQEI